MALRVGYEKLNRETGWEPLVSWEEGVAKTIAGTRENRERWIGRVDWLSTGRPTVAARDEMRTLVTGGGGFLGSHLVERLEAEGDDVFAARQRDFDLTRWDDTERLFEEARPERVFHLAAEVGGIGANLANPGRYWYANLMMGAHVLEQSRLRERREARRSSAPSARIRSSRRCRSARTTSGTAIPRRRTRRTASRRRRVLVGAQAYREQYGLQLDLPAADEPLRPARQLPPDERARDPGPDPQDGRLAGGGRALGRRLADARVPLRRRLRRGARARRRALRRARAGEPRRRQGDLDPRARRARRRA